MPILSAIEWAYPTANKERAVSCRKSTFLAYNLVLQLVLTKYEYIIIFSYSMHKRLLLLVAIVLLVGLCTHAFAQSPQVPGTINKAQAVAVMINANPDTLKRAYWFGSHMPPLPLFRDTDQSQWYSPYLEAAFEKKIEDLPATAYGHIHEGNDYQYILELPVLTSGGAMEVLKLILNAIQGNPRQLISSC